MVHIRISTGEFVYTAYIVLLVKYIYDLRLSLGQVFICYLRLFVDQIHPFACGTFASVPQNVAPTEITNN